MTDEVVTAGAQDTLSDVAAKMKQHDTGFIPVVEGKKMLGVITDRDLAIRGYAEKLEGSATVDRVMSTDVTSVTPDMSADDAAKKMANGQIRRLPVVENGELLGVVSIGDLAVRQSLEDEAGDALSEISEKSNSGMLQ